jgi:hypothetical protein
MKIGDRYNMYIEPQSEPFVGTFLLSGTGKNMPLVGCIPWPGFSAFPFAFSICFPVP